MLYSKKKALLAKIETTEGQDANPSPSTDAILVNELNPDAGDAAIHEVASVISLSPVTHHVGAYYGGFECQVALKGSGNDSPAGGSDCVPDFAVLLKACGAQESLNDSPAYALYEFKDNITPTDIPSITAYCFEDIRKHPYLGCRGVMRRIGGRSGEQGIIEFAFRGKQGTKADDSTVWDNIQFKTLEAPTLLGVTFNWETLNAPIREFELAFEGDPIMREDLREDTGYASALVTQFKMTGRFVFEALPFADFNEWQKFLNESETSLSLVIDAGTGQKITITVPKAKYLRPETADADGILVATINFAAYPDDNHVICKLQFE